MNSQEIKSGNKKFDKKEFYSSKKEILLDFVDPHKIVVSNKWEINDTTWKYICGYLDSNIIRPLCIILPQMSGYIKYFDDGAKNMSFITDDKNVYEKYNEIWNVIKKLLKIKFTVDPIRNDKYLVAMVKVLNGINYTTFTDGKMPVEKNHYLCILPIDIDSVLKVDKKTISTSLLRAM